MKDYAERIPPGRSFICTTWAPTPQIHVCGSRFSKPFIYVYPVSAAERFNCQYDDGCGNVWNKVSGGKMGSKNDEIDAIFNKARQEYEIFEKLYRALDKKAKEYLKHQAMEYKRTLLDIQAVILPFIEKICPACKGCCKLVYPEQSIYIPGTVGGFTYVDYLLVRSDTVLPEPNYENAKRNVCPFFCNGCILPADCRSFLCINFFCYDLKEALDMELISGSLNKAGGIVNNFSIARCMA